MSFRFFADDTSPVVSPVFMNWTMHTLRPWPEARIASPNAAVVLPFPGPVMTCTRPSSEPLLIAPDRGCN